MIPLLALAALALGPVSQAPPVLSSAAALAPTCVIEARLILVDASLPAPRSATLRSVDPGFAAAEALAKSGTARFSPTLVVGPEKPAENFIGDEIRYVKSLERTDKGVNLQTDKVRSGCSLKARSAAFLNGLIGIHVEVDFSTIEGLTETPDPAVFVPQLASLRREVFLRPDRRESAVIDLGILTPENALTQIMELKLDPERPQRLLLQLTARLAGR